MSQVFVIRNQHGLYLSKQQEWVDGSDNQVLFRCAHHDEAINTVFEVSAKDIMLRAETLACPLDAKNHPRVEAAGQFDFDAEADPADTAPAGEMDTGAIGADGTEALPPEAGAASPQTAMAAPFATDPG
jgi:hypothetical protein